MRPKLICTFILACVALNAVSAADNAPLPFVSPMFGDNMVLQRGKPIRFWGWAKSGESIQIELDGRKAKTLTGPDGRWQAEIKSPPPGGPYTVKISGAEQNVVLHEVLVGDVRLCGGQSNMELPLSRTRNGADEIQSANHPEIRLFKVHSRVSYSPAPAPQGAWQICSPQTIAEEGGFSAVAYFFGRKLQEELHVPIGLIQDCMGGTPAESWMSPESLHTLKDFNVPLAEIDRLHAKGGQEYGSFLMHWLDEYDLVNNAWSAANFDDSSWKPVQLPGGFAELGVADVPSVCWF